MITRARCFGTAGALGSSGAAGSSGQRVTRDRLSNGWFVAVANRRLHDEIYTRTSQESEREAARTVERAIYGDLFLICSSNETGTKTAAVN
jgi:hypothetical protein